MKIERSPIEESLPVLVLMSHGYLASALLSSAKMIAGNDISSIVSICLEEGDNPQDFKDEVKKVLSELPKKRLVLVDLFGGTPCNSFLASLKDAEEKEAAIAGMNLPMLLELIGCRSGMDSEELRDLALNCGKESICNVTERIFG